MKKNGQCWLRQQCQAWLKQNGQQRLRQQCQAWLRQNGQQRLRQQCQAWLNFFLINLNAFYFFFLPDRPG